MSRPGVVALLIAMIGTGCGSGGDSAGRDVIRAEPLSSPSSSPLPVATSDPSAMVGLWRVEAKDEATSTALRLGHGLVLWRRCATFDGEWRATTSGDFLADRSGWSARCSAEKTGSTDLPEWLSRATAYRVAGADRELLDKDGSVVATLRPDSRRASPDQPDFPKPPAGAELAKPSPRPAITLPPLKTPSREELLGKWYPEAAPGGEARLEVKADGTWFASDGCNGTGGRWTLAGDGTLLSIGGPSTLIGCQNDQSGFNFAGTRSVRLDGGVLVLLDSTGALLSRLVRR